MNPTDDHFTNPTRRQFFGRSAAGLGVPALLSLLGREGPGVEGARSTRGLGVATHFAPTAKRAIYLFMSGAPSQLDTLDYKPQLADKYDEDLPDEIRRGQRLTTMTSGQDRFPIAPSIYRFQQYDNGGDGAWVSELMPHTATMVKDIAIVRSMRTEAINHDPAITYFCTGDERPGKPSLGSWLNYGLGSLNDELPSFVVMNATWSAKRDAQALYNRLWGSGFLPSRHQGVLLRSQGDPVLYLRNPAGVDERTRRDMLDALAELNHHHFERLGDPEIQSRIQQYEMAFRMQTSVPELTNLAGETKETMQMYGPDVSQPGTFASSCLLARRLVEREVRFVQIFHRGWDQHGNLTGDLPRQCRDIDQPATALIRDLKQRGLLEDTLVVWGGEFGRTAYCQGKLTKTNYGRDHHPKCFTVWLAGGGVQGGVVHGRTDDYSYNIIDDAGHPTTRFEDDAVHVRDLNATILHCMGIDHRRLTVKFKGLEQRLTGVEEEAHIVQKILT